MLEDVRDIVDGDIIIDDDLVVNDDEGDDGEPENENNIQNGEYLNENVIRMLISHGEESEYLINQIKCATHTLQLAVNDFLKKSDALTLQNITAIHKFVIILRKPKHRNVLKKENYPMPIVNNNTRWNSTYYMVERFEKLKPYIDQHKSSDKELIVPERIWTFAREFIEVFEPVKKLTVQMQETQLLVGDFYKKWIELKIVLQKFCQTKPFAKVFLKYFEEREKMLFENEIITSALYLDPRFHCLLSPEKKTIAIKHLKMLYMHIRRIISNHNNTESNGTIITEQDQNDEECSTEETMDEMLDKNIKEQTKMPGLNNTIEDSGEILKSLNEIENFKLSEPLSVTTNILNYWAVKSIDFPVLSMLAKIVHSVPVTQVSVERCFSTLKFFLTDKRNKLNSTRLEDLIIIKCNPLLSSQCDDI